MATQTDLEKIGIERRRENIIKNDFNKQNAYSATNEAALTHDDDKHPHGKGTNSGGHTVSTPQPFNPSTKNLIKPQIDTTDGGGSYDKYGRNGVGGRFRLMGMSKYNENNQYPTRMSVDEQMDGQYFVKVN